MINIRVRNPSINGRGNAMKHKSKINFIIDILMYVVMMAIGGIGFLMKFVLVSGSERWEIYGDNVDLFLWGWDRHQWGTLHLIFGYLLLGLLLLHIVLHWSQIKSMFRNLIHKRSKRVALTLVFVILGLLLLLFPFIVDFEVAFLKQGERGRRVDRSRPEVNETLVSKQKEDVSTISSEQDSPDKKDVHQESSVDVVGSMSLKELENKHNMPADAIKKFLGIPLSASDNESLGRLRRTYNFNMSEIGRFIEKYKGENGLSEISEKEIGHQEKSHKDTETRKEHSIDINGRMTLKEIENQYKVPAASLKKFIGIPMWISDYENLGRLKRRYRFKMSDVEQFIQEYH